MEFRAATPANALDLTKGVNEVVSIPPGGTQNFLLGVRPASSFASMEIPLVFRCSNIQRVTTYNGVNSVIVAASISPTPDVVALAATVTNDGVVNIPGNTGTGFFAVSTINVGSAGTMTATVDDGGRGLALSTLICRTNPSTGACITPLGTSSTSSMAAGESATFTVLVTGNGNVPFDPANNRLFVRLNDGSPGGLRGATSVAPRTVP
jgi:hypothetical protein